MHRASARVDEERLGQSRCASRGLVALRGATYCEALRRIAFAKYGKCPGGRRSSIRLRMRGIERGRTETLRVAIANVHDARGLSLSQRGAHAPRVAYRFSEAQPLGLRARRVQVRKRTFSPSSRRDAVEERLYASGGYVDAS